MKIKLIALVWILIFPSFVLAQNEQLIKRSAYYTNEIDSILDIKSVVVLPFQDNVQGIYSRPLEAQVKKWISLNHHWKLIEEVFAGPPAFPSDLETNFEEVKRLGKSVNADAVIASRIEKGPSGVMIVLDLFSSKDGKLVTQERISNLSKFDLASLSTQMDKMTKNLFSGLPYAGRVLSRSQNRVTIDLGSKDGLKIGNLVSAILVISVDRHPKFNFIVQTQKEVLGKIRIEKTEETLSFGVLETEKEIGVIQKGTKLAPVNFYEYSSPQGFGGKQPIDSNFNFGKNPTEWVPEPPPTFGAVSVRIGLGNYRNNILLNTSGSLNSKVAVYPSLLVDGELWITANWYTKASIKQGIMTFNNPISNSVPEKLNVSQNKFDFLIGYNFLLKPDFFGPKIQTYLGFSQNALFVDSSTPLAFTTTKYKGLFLGFGGQFPIARRDEIFLGIYLNYFLAPGLVETPVTSGASSNDDVISFSVFIKKKIKNKLNLIGTIDFENYSSTFTGNGTRVVSGTSTPDPASSASQKTTTLTGGVEFLF